MQKIDTNIKETTTKHTARFAKVCTGCLLSTVWISCGLTVCFYECLLAVKFFWMSVLVVETFACENKHTSKFSAHNCAPLSYMFGIVNVVKDVAEYSFCKNWSRHWKMVHLHFVPGWACCPGNLRLTTTALNLYWTDIQNQPTKTMNAQVEVNAQQFSVPTKLGFLESSQEQLCMKPFKEHPRGLEAYEQRL